MNPRSMSYEQLEEQWQPLLRKFASWAIPGMGFEDIMQEMRIVLYKTQQNFNPRKRVKFITFLYRALLNRALQLLHVAGSGSNPRQRTVPPGAVMPMCTGYHEDVQHRHRCFICSDPVFAVQVDTELTELLAGASPSAVAVGQLIARGNATLDECRRAMPTGQADAGIQELRSLLRENSEKEKFDGF